ncbi:unnamed protein product, partial [Leptidea sinapis]
NFGYKFNLYKINLSPDRTPSNSKELGGSSGQFLRVFDIRKQDKSQPRSKINSL